VTSDRALRQSRHCHATPRFGLERIRQAEDRGRGCRCHRGAGLPGWTIAGPILQPVGGSRWPARSFPVREALEKWPMCCRFLNLHGLSSKEFVPALAEFFGRRPGCRPRRSSGSPRAGRSRTELFMAGGNFQLFHGHRSGAGPAGTRPHPSRIRYREEGLPECLRGAEVARRKWETERLERRGAIPQSSTTPRVTVWSFGKAAGTSLDGLEAPCAHKANKRKEINWCRLI
jgi:hypothetical protein